MDICYGDEEYVGYNSVIFLLLFFGSSLLLLLFVVVACYYLLLFIVSSDNGANQLFLLSFFSYRRYCYTSSGGTFNRLILLKSIRLTIMLILIFRG